MRAILDCGRITAHPETLVPFWLCNALSDTGPGPNCCAKKWRIAVPQKQSVLRKLRHQKLGDTLLYGHSAHPFCRPLGKGGVVSSRLNRRWPPDGEKPDNPARILTVDESLRQWVRCGQNVR